MFLLLTSSSTLENKKNVNAFLTHCKTDSGYVLVDLLLDIVNLKTIYSDLFCAN